MEKDYSWDFIDSYFKNNKQCLVKHHIDSYNDFFETGIKNIFKEKNPVKIMKTQDPDTKDFKNTCELYFGGLNGDKLYYGKPVIYDETRTHFMYPNEARARNMTYGFTIHYDIDVIFKIINDAGDLIETNVTLEKIFLGRFPIMLQSNLCILTGLTPELRFNMGECRHDNGAYFIINGKEKLIIPQEKFADNMLYVRNKVDDKYSHSAEIRSVSDDASKPKRTLAVKMVAPDQKLKNGQIVVSIPNVRMPIPLFIVMRALGVVSDKEIIDYCLLNTDKHKNLIELFVPSVYDSGRIFNQSDALRFIGTFTKGKTLAHVNEILMNYFLPHIGELNFKAKALYLGYIVLKLLKVYKNEDMPTDRDSFKFKRVELSGTLLHGLFSEYYSLQQKDIYTKIDKEYYYHKNIYQDNFTSLIENNSKEYFKDRIVEEGFRKAFKGNWGAQERTKRPGVVQDLNRLSFNSALSHLRKLNLPLYASAKVIGPRLLHTTQWGVIDPLDTPDGGNVGLHKHLALSTTITFGYDSSSLIKILRKLNIKLIEECFLPILDHYTKLFINGNWIGVVFKPDNFIDSLILLRRNSVIPIYTSISWDRIGNEIYVSTDAGRLCRPVLFIENNNISYNRSNILPLIDSGKYTWRQLIHGFGEQKVEIDNRIVYDVGKLYGSSIGNLTDYLTENAAIIDYIDVQETETAMLAMYKKDIKKNITTHLEIHPSLMLGVMGNQIVFPEHNQLPRDLFSCGQSKQGVSLYHSNFHNRIDKMGVVLNYGQMPLVRSRYIKYINGEKHPYGENPIVAIMCYTGYNVEDSILFNKASVDRGMFRTTYFNMYESQEESTKVSGAEIDSSFKNIETENVIRKRPGYDYSQLDDNGLIKENTPLTEKTIVIGKCYNNLEDPSVFVDASSACKKGQNGIVDKSFITEGEEGFRKAKIRVRDERIPAIGDKFCSRCGQKGTVGIIINEEDMPFTKDGIRPDIIINPHAIPSRMTIGQLIECVMGKAGCIYGTIGDCTAFVNNGPKHEQFGKLLTMSGYHSTGNEYLQNGMTGEMLEAAIFIGPTYYMRLKHMVKDKINYRAKGPRTVLTRQTVGGRANDGGLRIGEMERDGVAAHGMTAFLKESMMERGDKYYMAVCNLSGTIAIYNEHKNIFISPYADGPIQFNHTQMNEIKLDSVSNFGREFSIVQVPYSLKLLMQELQTMNVQMRIITDDNIKQYLEFSDNFKKLSGKETMKEVSDTIFKKLNMSKLKKKPDPIQEPQLPQQLPKGWKYGDPIPEPEITGEYDYTDETLENPYNSQPLAEDWTTQDLPSSISSTLPDYSAQLLPTTPDYGPPKSPEFETPKSPAFEPSSPSKTPQLPVTSPTTEWKAPYELRNEQEAQNEIITPDSQKTFKSVGPDGKEYEYMPTSPTYTPPLGEDDMRVAVPAKRENFRELRTSEGKTIWVNNETGKYYENNPFE
jgi:DNA-directed RNA polymerase II subunit RPB2